ncbi:VRR-NUC domain-containing protein [Herbaspirillum sp. GCM10030257]|uniref:VRR-NUC domain-containing protein n=1 Tax=Herbaspirillum sp. GCM10030257 TaxID=3273393 RepID=UPI00360AD578
MKRHDCMPPPKEHEIQATFICWVRLAEKTDWRLKLLFAVPNAGKRTRAEAAWMLAEGLRAGVPDIMLPFPNGPFVGLAIEFKRPGEKTSEKQDDYIALLVDAGWLVVICTDSDAAVRTVQDYLRMK